MFSKKQDPRNCQFQFLLYWKPCFSSSPKGAPHGWCRRASVKEISREYLKFKAWTSATFQQCAWVRLLIAARGTLGLPPSSIHFVHYPTWKVFVFICDRLSLRLHTCAAPLLRLVVGCCWFAWTLWIPWYDSLKLLALIDCTSQSNFHFCQLQIASIWRRAHPFWAQRKREATPRHPFSMALMSTWRTSHIERSDPLSI